MIGECAAVSETLAGHRGSAAEELVTVPITARRLGLAEKTLWAWIAARRIGVVRLGRAVRIKNSEIQRLIDEGSTPARESRA
jgi:excisionase family DNA binding protein